LNYPLKSHSWLLESPNIAIKQADKTFVKSLETGVPLDIVHFFHVAEVEYGNKSGQIEFVVNSNLFDIRLQRKSDGRHKLVFNNVRHYLGFKSLSIGDEVWFERCLVNSNRFYVYTKSELFINSILPVENINEVSEYQVLTKQRVGQSYFRSNVFSVCNGECIVTGVKDSRVLIASHIKPWRESNHIEKYDGHNGLLLSPHIDKLFDTGLITFSNNGLIRYSKSLDTSVFNKWEIDIEKEYQFSDKQFEYLEYHQTEIFK
jgi:hypothetical protein